MNSSYCYLRASEGQKSQRELRQKGKKIQKSQTGMPKTEMRQLKNLQPVD